jgi:hypothetical protein
MLLGAKTPRPSVNLFVCFRVLGMPSSDKEGILSLSHKTCLNFLHIWIYLVYL